MGYVSPAKMLDDMSREEWQDWQAFMEVEPFPAVQANVQHANLTALLRNIHRDSKQHPNPYTIEECVLRFGDDLPTAPTRNQDWRITKANFFKAVGVTREEGKSRRAPAPERPPKAPRPARQKRGAPR
jgi:hypothetical protein